MSSPPNYSNSPPRTTPLSLPKKRPSTSTAGPSSSKRRKPSVSSTSHPLRQTSFPPEDNGLTALSPSYSPPVEDSLSVAGERAATSVTGASSVGRGKRGKGRGRGDARSSVRGRSEVADGRGSVADGDGAGREDEDGEDEADDGGEDAVLEDGGKNNEAASKMQKEHLAMLVNAFSDDQMDRYNIWRRIKLKKETVRKLTNQTLSQSVSPAIIVVINGYTKTFIGELIERAREVQTEWLAASPTLPTGEPKAATTTTTITPNGTSNESKNADDVTTTNVPAAPIKLEKPEDSPILISSSSPPSAHQPNGDNTNNPSPQPHPQTQPHPQAQPQPPTPSPHQKAPTTQNPPANFQVHERDRGPLTPDHLREALRRYKKDREGGGVGFMGLSLQGREGVAARVGGGRLFR